MIPTYESLRERAKDMANEIFVEPKPIHVEQILTHLVELQDEIANDLISHIRYKWGGKLND